MTMHSTNFCKQRPLSALALWAWTSFIGSSVAFADTGRLTHQDWFVIKKDDKANGIIYRRWSVQKSGDMSNIMMYNCPSNRSKYTHLTLSMKSIITIHTSSSDNWQNLEPRFLVNGRHSFSLPGELINQDLFFDRTSSTSAEFDELLNSKEFTIRLGDEKLNVRFVADAKLTPIIKPILENSHIGDLQVFTTQEMLDQCENLRKKSPL